MLNWSEGKIQGLQGWARCGYPFMELVAQSKLAVVGGDLETAGRILDEVLEKYAEKRQERDFLQHISTVSIIARRLDVAERLIAERLAPGWRAEVRPDSAYKEPRGRSQVDIGSNDKTLAFEINEDVFASDQTEFFLQRWIYYLPLFAVCIHIIPISNLVGSMHKS